MGVDTTARTQKYKTPRGQPGKPGTSERLLWLLQMLAALFCQKSDAAVKKTHRHEQA